MRRLYLALLTCCLFFTAHSQLDLPEFGRIDIADLQLKECPFDKGADAMNLFNYQGAEIYASHYGDAIDIEHRVRIKIFTQPGVKYASVNIPYYDDGNRIKDIAAFTYNLDPQGKIVIQKIERKDIFKEKVSEGEKSVKFAFPNVKQGSVIEYKYTEKRDFILNLEPWIFDDDIPTQLSYCKLNYPLYIHPGARFIARMPVQHTTDTMQHFTGMDTYIMNNIPAYRYEPFMPSAITNVQRVEFSMLQRWSGNKLLPLEDQWAYIVNRLITSPYFGYNISCDIPEVQQQIDSIKKLPNKQKIEAVCQLVKSKIKWDNTHDFYAENIQGAWLANKGTSAQINFLIINLMRKAGINCYPLLTSTKSHGVVDNKDPTLSQFNCVDVLVVDSAKSYIIDGTQKYQPYNVPPYNVLNNYGLLIDRTHGRWLKIEDTRPLIRNAINVKAEIDSTGIMRGTVYEYFYDYAKVDMLANAHKNTDKDESKDLLQNEIVDLKIDSIKEDNADSADKPLIRSFNFTLEMQQTGDFIFFNPMFLSSFKKNPFKDSARHADIDFGCNQSYSVGMYITMPENMEIPELPPNKEIRLADTSFAYGRLMAKQNNALVIRSHFELNNAVFAADQYPLVKQVFEKMYDMLNEQVMFKRKN